MIHAGRKQTWSWDEEYQGQVGGRQLTLSKGIQKKGLWEVATFMLRPDRWEDACRLKGLEGVGEKQGMVEEKDQILQVPGKARVAWDVIKKAGKGWIKQGPCWSGEGVLFARQ